MFDWLTYDLVKDFQSLIVGAVGFGGVIWTLRHSAKLTREQHDRGVQHERTLITRALLAELRRNRDNFVDNLETFNKRQPGLAIMMPRRTITEMYEKNFSRISHLNEDELRNVLDAYSKIKAVPDRIMFSQSMRLPWNDIVIHEQYIQVDPRFVDLYKTLLQNALEAVNTAIQTLEAN